MVVGWVAVVPGAGPRAGVASCVEGGLCAIPAPAPALALATGPEAGMVVVLGGSTSPNLIDTSPCWLGLKSVG